MNKNKLRKVLNILSPDGTAVDFKAFDDNVAQLKESLKEKIQIKTLDDVNAQLDIFKEKINFDGIYESVRGIESSLEEKINGVRDLLATETTDFSELLKKNNGKIEGDVQRVLGNIDALRNVLNTLDTQKNSEIRELKKRIEKLPDFEERVDRTFSNIRMSVQAIEDNDDLATVYDIESLTDEIEKLRKELTNRINNFPRGGGNANRNIAIGGNTSVLSTFTDINLIAGSGITISYTKNQTTKYTDVTITGSGSGSGIIREINNIAVDTLAGATAGTDYVYNVSGTTTLTLPDAAGNTNLYSVKNVGTDVVTVATTGGDTIDGSSTAALPIQYLQITLYSDGSNWNVGV